MVNLRTRGSFLLSRAKGILTKVKFAEMRLIHVHHLKLLSSLAVLQIVPEGLKSIVLEVGSHGGCHPYPALTNPGFQSWEST